MQALASRIVDEPLRGALILPLVLFLFACESATEPPGLCEAQADIPEAECGALVALYEATNGPGWERSDGWLESESPCDWHGITCEAALVRMIVLPSNELEGPIPSELGGLSGLRLLRLEGNALIGSIPPSLGDLAALEGLSLAANDLTGPIPPELGSLENVWYLHLFSNRLSGSIPAELADMSALRLLFLRANELSGTIPAELGAMPSLQRLVINDNRLTGTVPEEIGALDGLDIFWIHGNELEGALPLEVAQMGAAIQHADRPEDCRASPGNDGLFIPDDEAYRAADLDDDGMICGLAVGGGA